MVETAEEKHAEVQITDFSLHPLQIVWLCKVQRIFEGHLFNTAHIKQSLTVYND